VWKCQLQGLPQLVLDSAGLIAHAGRFSTALFLWQRLQQIEKYGDTASGSVTIAEEGGMSLVVRACFRLLFSDAWRSGM